MEHKFNDLPELRGDLGYKWNRVPLEEAFRSFISFLERNNAKAFRENVYASNGRAYCNIVIQFPELGEAFPAEDINIQFDRDEGRQFTLVKK